MRTWSGRLRLDDLVDELFFRLPASPKRRDADDLFRMMIEQFQPFFRCIIRR
jgi:hypothetical protein